MLFVVSESDLTHRAIMNLRQMFERCRPGESVEVVDILDAPHRALNHQVYVAPTLVCECDSNVRRLVGDMSDPDLLVPFLSNDSLDG